MIFPKKVQIEFLLLLKKGRDNTNILSFSFFVRNTSFMYDEETSLIGCGVFDRNITQKYVYHFHWYWVHSSFTTHYESRGGAISGIITSFDGNFS